MATKKAAKAVEKEEGIKNYDLSGVYEKGDVLFHDVWQDQGTVSETGITEDGFKKCVVKFDKMGEKRLIMDYKA